MKKNFFLPAFLVLIVCSLSNKIFAQDVPGGSAGDGIVNVGNTGKFTGSAIQPLAYQFAVNNNESVCGGKAQIKMFYKTLPSVAPVLNQIYYMNAPLFSSFQPVVGKINDSSKKYVSFCTDTMALPPAIKLTLTYTPGTSQNQHVIKGN